MRRRITILLWTLTALLLCSGILFFTAIWNGWIGYVPNVEELENPISRYASQVISDDGELLGTFSYNENRIFAAHDEVSPAVFKALVATEDKRFYQHSGIDIRGLARAVVKRGILHQKSAGGGSTITQQLAKQLYTSVAPNSTERIMQKAIEWVIALKLEHYYSKDEILTLYINDFDFLHHAVGIKSAAKVYFNKEPDQLTVPEAAMLVGMCKNPSYFNPIRNPERVKERRNTVLQLMADQGYITQYEADAYMQQDLGLNFQRVSHDKGIATYYREYLRHIMMAKRPERDNFATDLEYNDALWEWDNNSLYGWCNKHFKDDGEPYNIYTDGLKIHATINSRMQRYAEQAVREHVGGFLQRAFNRQKYDTPSFPYASSLSASTRKRLLRQAIRQTQRYRLMKADGADDDQIMQTMREKVPMTVFTYHGEVDTIMSPIDSILYHKAFLQAGFMSMDPVNGYVKAWVGGIDYTNFQYDMCGQSHRQVGSTIKPYLYALAMENGMTPCDLVLNVQRTYGNWSPRNGSKARYGQLVPLEWGLAQSNNWISAYLIDKFGPVAFVQTLKNFGIRHDIQPNLTLCLGTCEISVKEMVSAYTAFVNSGLRVTPLLVTKIEDSDGHVIETFRTSTDEVISPESSYRMLHMMQAVINQGTGRRLRFRYGFTAPIAGKTGTTQNNSDGWFMGVVPRLVSGCWVGGENPNIHFNSMAMGQGASMALPVWALYMKKVWADPTLGYSQDEAFNIPQDFDMCGQGFGFDNDSIQSSSPTPPEDDVFEIEW